MIFETLKENGVVMLINQLTPVLLLPTIPQQIVRVAAKDSFNHRFIVHDWQDSGSCIYRNERVRRENELNEAYSKLYDLDRVAMNVALKLLRCAFGRYSVGVDPYAVRMAPSHILGRLRIDTFAAMVQTHAQRFVRSSCSIKVATNDRQLWLSVKLAHEPKLKMLEVRYIGSSHTTSTTKYRYLVPQLYPPAHVEDPAVLRIAGSSIFQRMLQLKDIYLML